MQMHESGNRENKNRSVANEAAQKATGSEAAFLPIADNRAEAIQARNLQKLANSSPRMLQLKSMQELANGNPQNQQIAGLHQPESTGSHPVNEHHEVSDQTGGGIARTPIVQLKKSVQPPFTDLNKGKLRATANGTVGNAGTDEAKRAAIWQHLDNVYETNRAKGAGYWTELNTRIAQYVNNKDAYTARMQIIRAEYDRRYNAHYITQFGEGKGKMQTAGVSEKNAEVKPEFDHYNNTMDTDSGTITADYVYATKDPARISDDQNRNTPHYLPKGLPNSEVLWKQYFEAAKSKFWVFKESRAKEAMQNLNRIIQSHILNNESLQAAYMALPNGQSFDTAHTWVPGNNDFLAVLGTPNGRSSAHMLGDHLDETGGKTIRHIRATGEGDANLNNVNFDIEFETIPQEVARIQAEAEAAAAAEALQELLMLLVAASYGEAE